MRGVSKRGRLSGREGEGVGLQVDLGVRSKDPSSIPQRGGNAVKRDLLSAHT